jgi:FBD
MVNKQILFYSVQLIGFINCPYSGVEFRKLPSCPHHHLKSVRIRDYTCSKDQIELVEYILENATALDVMIIKTKAGPYKDAAIGSSYLTNDMRIEIL